MTQLIDWYPIAVGHVALASPHPFTPVNRVRLLCDKGLAQQAHAHAH
jgi:hypothetical protein